MNDSFQLEIPIPSDDDGYVLLQCSHCGEFFKATPSDFKDNGVLEIYCPCCGLTNDNYITEDVIELAQSMVKNVAMKIIYDELKKMERKFAKGIVTFNAGKKPETEPENPIRSGIEALNIVKFPCCNRTAKIKLMLKMTGCYCPFCGVKNYEIE